MIRAMRARSVYKKATVITAAFVLAVSSLTASVPFILSSKVGAVNPSCEIEFSGSHQKCVKTLDEFKSALSTPTVSYIVLNDTIETTSTIVIDRPITINGHDEKLVLTGDQPGWQGKYVLQVYNTKAHLNSVQFEGGDAGLLVNGSEVNLTGNMRFSNHEFGNIELGKGSGVTAMPKLNIPYANSVAGNNNETKDKPFVWTASNVADKATVDSPYLFKGVNRSGDAVNNGAQVWYYANPENTGIATNERTAKVFPSIQAAIDDSSTIAGDTITLNSDIVLDQLSIRVTKGLAIDGRGHTVRTTFDRNINGVSNAGFVVTTSGVTIKNIVVEGNNAGKSAAHGIVIHGVNSVQLDKVTLKNNAAGLIVSGSEVKVSDISTINNNWYGINVDNANASLVVSGASVHEDSNGTPAIFTEKNNAVSIKVSQKYVKETNGLNTAYYYDISNPVATLSPVAAKVNGSIVVEGAVSDDRKLSHYNLSLYRGDVNLSDGGTHVGERVTTKGWPANDWSATSGTQSTVKRTLDTTSLDPGTYQVRLGVRDAANNNHFVVVRFEVDRQAPQVSINDINSAVATPTITGTTDDPTAIIAVTINSVTKTTTPDANGVWSIIWEELDNNTYTIRATAFDGLYSTDAQVATLVVNVQDDGQSGGGGSPTTPVIPGNPSAPGDPQPATEDTESESEPVAAPDTTTTLANGGLPLANFGVIGQQVLGDSTANPQANNGTSEGSPAVEGVSTQNTAAQAVDSDANQGRFMGLAWYWWLLILAGVAMVGWWIAAAVRRRSAES